MLSKSSKGSYEREYGVELARRLLEPRRLIQVVAGARQVGKTTLVQQVLSTATLPNVVVSADEPAGRDASWLSAQWERARLMARGSGGAVLAVDEIQKIPDWSEVVKAHWDADTRDRIPLKTVLLGSSPFLVQRGLTESLAGRFEILRLPHWSLSEMQEAFGLSIDQYTFFGGYPGAAHLIDEPARWRRYILDALIETTISRDVLLLTRVNKPALLRQLFELSCSYSGQVLSYTKMLGRLHDAGNTTTLAHYLELLAGSELVRGLEKYTAKAVRRRSSSPKLQVMNNALMAAMSGLSPDEARSDRAFRARLIESAVGAHLANAASRGVCELFYWRDRNREVDFVLRGGRRVVAIEVKSGDGPARTSGLQTFSEEFRSHRSLLVGGDGLPVDQFLLTPVEDWLE